MSGPPPAAADTAALTAADFAALLAALGPFEPAPRIAVAVSGGPDSMALALLAHGWARARGGAVVLVSSINGERGKLGQASYAASKAGLIGLGRTAARELGAFGVRVNVVAPGWIDTPMTAAAPPEARRRATVAHRTF